MTTNTALITGASSGIGLELARLHAQKGGDLVLVARSEEILLSLKQELEQLYNIQVFVIAADLSVVESAEAIFSQTQSLGITIDVLINNAGFGGHGEFYQRDLATEQQMMQLNIITLTSLTHYYLQGMLDRNRGRILNVSSTASFLPGPLQAVYYATKAYVTSFSQAIAEEVSHTNITVTALCPGPVVTNFVKVAAVNDLEVWDNAATAISVAQCGYKAMEKGQLVVFNEHKFFWLLRIFLPFVPRRWVLKISRYTMEKRTKRR